MGRYQVGLHKPRLLVTGSRDFGNFDLMYDAIKHYISIFSYPECLIHGDARGADKMADGIAKNLQIPILKYPVSDAEWKAYPGSAGRLRNIKMLKEGRPTHVMAFFAGRRTAGTQHMVHISKEANIQVKEFGLED